MDLFAEILRDLPDGDVIEIASGSHWTGVLVKKDGMVQCGLASNPVSVDGTKDDSSNVLAGLEDVQSARELCELVYKQGGPLASVGLATVNALLPRYPDTWVETNAGEMIVKHGQGKKVALVGHFPFLDDVRPLVGHLDVLELRPRDGDIPASEAPNIIPQADVLACTSMTLLNGTFQGLMALRSPEAYVIVIGPSTPLSPVMFDYGANMLCGSIVENCEPVLESVKQGMGFRKIKTAGVRLVSVVKQ